MPVLPEDPGALRVHAGGEGGCRVDWALANQGCDDFKRRTCILVSGWVTRVARPGSPGT